MKDELRLNNKGPEEEAWVRCLLAGDEEARDAFYHRHKRALYGTAAVILGRHSADAEDMVQETFIAALRNLDGFQFRSSLGTWLNRICVNQCLSLLRKRKNEAAEAEALLVDLGGAPLHEVLAQSSRLESQRESLALIRNQWHRLRQACREVLGWRHVEELSYAEISAKLKAPIGTVMSRLARCKQQLKDLVTQARNEAGLG